MNQVMPIVPTFMGTYERHRGSCELLWVVTNQGFDCSYPVDYEKFLIRNPGMNELDESLESYVKDFGPANNPDREVRWSKPYIDYIKQKWMISCIAPLYDQDKFIGTTGVDVLLGAFTEWLQKFHVGRSGYAFLVSGEGTRAGASCERNFRFVLGGRTTCRVTDESFRCVHLGKHC